MNVLTPRPITRIGRNPVTLRDLRLAFRAILGCLILGVAFIGGRAYSYVELAQQYDGVHHRMEIAVHEQPFPFVNHDELVTRTTTLEAARTDLENAHRRALAQVAPIVRITQALPLDVRLSSVGATDPTSGAPPNSIAIAGEAKDLPTLNDRTRSSLRRAGFGLTILSIAPVAALPNVIRFSGYVTAVIPSGTHT